MDTTIQVTQEFLNDRPLSYSSLKEFRKSPKHYTEYVLQAKKEYVEAFVLGNAVETLVFDESNFVNRFELFEKFAKRSNVDKEKWELMLENAKANNKILIDTETFALANIMAKTVKNTPETAYYLEHVKAIQKKLSWTDKKTGIPIIGYVDAECEIDEHLIIIDFKTSDSSDPNEFYKSAASFDYEIQVGCYLTGYHKKYFLFPEFMFMVVEKKAPYNATMIHCPGDYVNYAKEEFEHSLTAFKYCMDKQEFHRGYHFWDVDMGYFNMEKPRWKKSKFINK